MYYPFDSNQKDVIIGTLLGDATIATRAGRPYLRLKFEQKTTSKPYINHLHEVFSEFVGSPPAPRWNKEKTKIVSFWVATRTNPSFKYYYDLFYSQGKKQVPKQIVRLLTPKVLAYWFMDDGTCKIVKKKLSFSYGLSTQGFTYQEQYVLANALKEKFGLKVTVNKSGKYYKLYISTESSSDFRKLVQPFILPIFQYKLGKSQTKKG